MKYRTLGKTGEKVSVLGYGCMRLPTVGNDYGKVDDAAAMKLVPHAVDNGVNCIDTSWPYHSLDPFREGTGPCAGAGGDRQGGCHPEET